MLILNRPSAPAASDGDEHHREAGARFGRDTAIPTTGLSRAQRRGAGCVVCDKRWPRPHIPVGRFPDGSAAYACQDCAALLGVDARGPGL
ncbi:hypothetical protein [Actinomadura roseirufa]|uniref:hypothetical protein n=1 Tax=Actinomadura roseirufa TaxID=2094049 RepID=UPI00104165DA|nr:hypothetical protein [Actinomadura roseirufa]